MERWKFKTIPFILKHPVYHAMYEFYSADKYFESNKICSFTVLTMTSQKVNLTIPSKRYIYNINFVFAMPVSLMKLSFEGYFPYLLLSTLKTVNQDIKSTPTVYRIYSSVL